MYLIGRPWMPPLSFTQSKYALATLPIVVKSTPGMSMSMPPILIGAPVAFLPLPRPQTLFVADAVPEPTLAVVFAALAARLAVASSAAENRNAAISLRTLIRSVLSAAVVSLRESLLRRARRAGAGTPERSCAA